MALIQFSRYPHRVWTAVIHVSPRAVMTALQLLISSSACSSPPEGRGPSAAAMSLVESVRLEESDTAFIGRAIGVAATKGGTLLVTEGHGRRVIGFTRRGELSHVLGRYGNGPGGFVTPSDLVVVNDSLLYVSDFSRGGVILWNWKDGREVRPLLLAGSPATLAVVGDTIYAGTLNFTKGTAFARWTANDDSVTYFGSLPPGLAQSPLREGFGRVTLAAWADSLAYSIGLSDVIFIATSKGVIRDSVRVPRRVRRGIPVDLNAARPDTRAIASRASLTFGMGRLSDGRLVVIHMDADFLKAAGSGKLYVSAASRDDGRVCVDMPLLHDAEQVPRVGFDGDTLLVLDQRVLGDSVFSTLHRFTISKGCNVHSLQ